MKQTNIKNLTLTALLISLTYVATAFIKIPIPYGYVNLGFSILILSSFFFGIVFFIKDESNCKSN